VLDRSSSRQAYDGSVLVCRWSSTRWTTGAAERAFANMQRNWPRSRARFDRTGSVAGYGRVRTIIARRSTGDARRTSPVSPEAEQGDKTKDIIGRVYEDFLFTLCAECNG
jgi:hypothetical protein